MIVIMGILLHYTLGAVRELLNGRVTASHALDFGKVGSNYRSICSEMSYSIGSYSILATARVGGNDDIGSRGLHSGYPSRGTDLTRFFQDRPLFLICRVTGQIEPQLVGKLTPSCRHKSARIRLAFGWR
jgi:hypothetical protein